MCGFSSEEKIERKIPSGHVVRSSVIISLDCQIHSGSILSVWLKIKNHSGSFPCRECLFLDLSDRSQSESYENVVVSGK